MLTTGEWCDPVSKISYRMKNGVEWGGIRHEKLKNSGSILTGLSWSLQR